MAAAIVDALIATYPDHHDDLQRAVAECGPHFVQLLASHPLLALLVATTDTAIPRRELVDWKRRDLLKFFGFPARPWYARLLARVPRESLTEEVALRFREPDALMWTALRTLRLTPTTVLLLTDDLVQRRVRLRLLREIEETWTIDQVQELRALLPLLPGRPLCRAKDAQRYLRLVHGWIGTYAGSNRPLGEHPIPGVRDRGVSLTPITTEGALLQESLLLQHCAVSMLDDALQGECWFYAVEIDGTRATLCLHRVPGNIVIYDFVGMRNDIPDTEYWMWMFSWLRDATADFIDEPTY